MKLSQHIVVQAPVEYCFDCLAQIEDAPHYLLIVKELKMLTPGKLQPGAKWRQTLSVFGKRVRMDAKVLHIQRPEGYSFTTTHRNIQMTMGFRLEAQGADATQIHLDLEGVGRGVLGKVALTAALPFKARIQTMAANELASLKNAIEEQYAMVGSQTASRNAS